MNEEKEGIVVYLNGKNMGVRPQEQGGFSTCPVCKKNSIRYGLFEDRNVAVYRNNECGACGAKWEERFDLAKVEITK